MCKPICYLDGFSMSKPLSRDEYWAKILQDLKDAYGFGESDIDKNTLASFKVMFDMGWDLHLYTQTDVLPENMHNEYTEGEFEEIQEVSGDTGLLEFPCLFESGYSKNTKH